MTFAVVFSALIVALGLIAIVLPVLPGLPIVWFGIFLWALHESVASAWITLAVCTLILAAGYVTEYLVPGRRMRRAGVRTSTLVVGVLFAIVGFFVVPVIGLFLGFPVGIYVVERVRRSGHAQAWVATTHALRAVGLNILIELATGAAIVVTWVVALIVT